MKICGLRNIGQPKLNNYNSLKLTLGARRDLTTFGIPVIITSAFFLVISLNPAQNFALDP